jgi:hypothetical protein
VTRRPEPIAGENFNQRSIDMLAMKASITLTREQAAEIVETFNTVF